MGAYSNTALAWGENVKEAALYFEHVIPMDRADNYDEELFSVLPKSLRDDRFEGVVKELWDVYLAYLDFQSERGYPNGLYFEEYQAAVTLFEERFCLTELPRFRRDESETPSKSNEIPFLALRNLRIINPSKLTWELVLDFRKDSEATSKIRRLRHFLETNYANRSKNYIEDDLAIKIDDYQSALKKWGFETKVGIIGILLKSKAVFGAVATSFAFALSGNTALSTAPLATGLLLDTGNVALELVKRSKERAELKRNNPFDYLIELGSR
jgi:hypothetical protein